MKRIVYPIAAVVLAAAGVANAVHDLSARTKQDVLEQWQNDRFGIFIH